MDKKLTGTFKKILNFGLKFATINIDKNILFPLHNRSYIQGENYSSYFEQLVKLKNIFDDYRSERVKIKAHPQMEVFKRTKLQKKKKTQPLDDTKKKSSNELRAEDINNNNRQFQLIASKNPKSQGNNNGPISFTKPTGDQNDSFGKNEGSSNGIFQFKEENELVPGDLINNRSLNNAPRLIGGLISENFLTEEENQLQVPQLKHMNMDFRSSNAVSKSNTEESKLKRITFLIALRSIDKPQIFRSDLLKSYFISSKNLNDEPLDSLENLSCLKQENYFKLIMKKYTVIRDYYYVDNEDLIKNTMMSLECSRPLRDKLYQLFPARKIEDFKDSREPFKDIPINIQFSITLFRNLKKYPVVLMRDYFGENVALFFAFLSTYRDWLVHVGIVGTLNTGIDFYYRSNPRFDTEEGLVERILEVSSVLFCLYCVLSSSYFISNWSQYENEFGVKFGIKNSNGEKLIRSGFETGILVRCYVSDKISKLVGDRSKRRNKYLATFLFLALYCGLTALACQTLLHFKRRAYSEGWFGKPIIRQLSYAQIIFDFSEFLRNQIFEFIFIEIIDKLVKWQNHKYIENHENNLILNMSLYQLFNNCCLIIIIYFDLFGGRQKDLVDPDGNRYTRLVYGNCIEDDCIEEIAFFVITYWCLMFLWRIFFHLIIRTFFIMITKKVSGAVFNKVSSLKKQAVERQRRFKDKNKLNTIRSHSLKVSSLRNTSLLKKEGELFNGFLHLISNLKNTEFRQMAEKKNAIVSQYENQKAIYNQIDRTIDEQVTNLKMYNIHEDVNPLLPAYLRIMNLYSFALLFGMFFSFCFVFCWIISIIDLYITRRKLLYETRRPIPSSNSSIGLWGKVLKLYSVLSLANYSFYFGMLFFYDKPTWFRFTIFVVVFLGFTTINFIFNNYSKQNGASVEVKIKRNEFVKKFLFSSEENIQQNNEERYEKPLGLKKSNQLFGLNGRGDSNEKHLRVPTAEKIENKDLKVEQINMKLLEFENRAVIDSNGDRILRISKQEAESLKRILAVEDPDQVEKD